MNVALFGLYSKRDERGEKERKKGKVMKEGEQMERDLERLLTCYFVK